MALRGSFQTLMLYDVADAIRLDDLRTILGFGGPERLPHFTRPAPDYVRFERPPVTQPIDPIGSLGPIKPGVHDYRNLVDQKLRTAAELYRFMVDQFQESRAFLLELIVVFILVLEIVLAFKGKL